METCGSRVRGVLVPKLDSAACLSAGPAILSAKVADASAMEQVFGRSELDWTMVRPPELTDEPHTGNYRLREGRLPIFGFKIAREGG